MGYEELEKIKELEQIQFEELNSLKPALLPLPATGLFSGFIA